MNIRCGALLGCLVLLVSCGGSPDPQTDAPGSSAGTEAPTRTPSPTPTGDAGQTGAQRASKPTAKPEGPRIVVGDSEFGAMLFDDTGQAIYLFDIETTQESECYGECAAAWPPVLTEGQPAHGDGVDASQLGTTTRADGQLQVTYNDHPLYYYAHEGKHEVLCHDVFLNGGNWYVVQPDGSAAPPG